MKHFILTMMFLMSARALAYAEVTSVRFTPIEKESGPTTAGSMSSYDLKPLSLFSNVGYCSKRYLFEVQIKNKSSSPHSTYLEVGNSTLKHLRVYQKEGMNLLPTITGFRPSIKLDLQPRESQTLMIEAEFGNASQISFKVSEKNNHNQDNLELIAALLGAMGGILAYTLLIFIAIRERVHLYYSLYGISVAICLSNLSGTSNFSSYGYVLNDYTTFFGPLALLFAGLFTAEFLRLKDHLPKLAMFFKIHGIFCGVVAVCFLATGYKELTYVTDFLIATGAPVVVWSGFSRWKSGYGPAKFFFLSWTVVMVVALYWVATIVGLTKGPSGALILSVGIFFEMLLLSLALSEHVSHLKRSLLLRQKRLNKELEEEVQKERMTIENQQKKLLFSEKMASLGLMAKGISHEVNNPLAILKGNAEILSLKIKVAKDAKDAKDETINLNSLEVQKISEKIMTQSERISDIVESLHNFARFDSEEEFEAVNLKEAVKQAITLTKNHARKNQVNLLIEVEESFFVMARLGKLIQVASNLIMNAIDACPPNGTVTIKATSEIETIKLFVVDTGPGVSPEIKDKIFEPFFSTKNSSKGTGLGLSISKRLMESMKGDLSLVTSEDGASFVAEFIASTKPNTQIAS